MHERKFVLEPLSEIAPNFKHPKTKKTTDITIGFEDSKELSYFMLACPHLKYN